MGIRVFEGILLVDGWHQAFLQVKPLALVLLS